MNVSGTVNGVAVTVLYSEPLDFVRLVVDGPKRGEIEPCTAAQLLADVRDRYQRALQSEIDAACVGGESASVVAN